MPFPSPTVADPGFAPQRRVGPCVLLERIGAGAMGQVWSAALVEPAYGRAAGERVAVKLLAASLADDPRARARFRREAELSMRVESPAVARTHGWGLLDESSAAWPFLVQELVEGSTLRELIGQLGLLPEPLVRHVGRQVAEGLAAIHAAGALHRDVKPANVLVTADHAVRLIDLGIAGLLEGASGLTGPLDFLGTPAHAAPEQAGGRGAGTASDLYALGVLLYEAATGVNPFDAGSREGCLRRHRELVPAAASSLVPSISRSLEVLLAQLLSKSPEQRPASAEEVKEALDGGESSRWWGTRRDPAAVSPVHEVVGRLTRGRRPTPLVARSAELEALRRAVARSAEGTSRVVVVEGEGGIGKSRLLLALAQWIADAAPATEVLLGRHEPPPSAAPAGLADALGHRFGQERLADGLGPLLGQLAPAAPGVAAALGATVPGAARIDPVSLPQLLGRAARGLAARGPAVWLVEDAHFATADSLALLAAAMDATRETPTTWIVTARPELRAGAGAALLRGVTHETLQLGRLSAREVVVMLEALIGHSAASRVAAAVAARTDGNPFFVVETIAELEQSGSLRRGDDGFVVDGSISTGVPRGVRTLLAARLEPLDDRDRSLLDVAAVAGHDFDAKVVSRVLGWRPLDVLQRLARLERRTGLVRADGLRFAFDHHLLHETILSAMPASLRRETHRLVAEATAAELGIDPGDAASMPGAVAHELATHLLRSGARVADELVDHALAHLASTARPVETLDLAGMALSAGPSPDMALALRLKQAKALTVTGLADDGRRAEVEAALWALRDDPDPGRAARALCGLSHLRNYTRDGAHSAEDVARRALERALESGDPALVAAARDTYSRSLLFQGRLQDAEAAVRGARSAAVEAGNIGAACSMAQTEMDLARAAGYPSRVETLADELVELARGTDREDAILAMALASKAGMLMDRGVFGLAEDVFARAQEVELRLGNTRSMVQTASMVALLRIRSGRWRAARASLESGAARAIGYRQVEACEAYYLAMLDVREQRDTASARVMSAIVTAQVCGIEVLVEPVRALQIDLREADGDLEVALAAARESLERLAVSDGFDIANGVRLQAARLAAMLGRRDEALEALASMRPPPERRDPDVGMAPEAWLAALGAGGAFLPDVPGDVSVRAEILALQAITLRTGEAVAAAERHLEDLSRHMTGDDLRRFRARDRASRLLAAGRIA